MTQALEDLQVLGADEATIAEYQAQADQAAAPFEVWPENWPAVELFCACATQWRFHPVTGQPTGLDYVAMELVSRSIGQNEQSSDVLEGVREMEKSVLSRNQL